MMLAKLWNWCIIVMMMFVGLTSAIAAFSQEWDKAAYFAIMLLIGKFAINEDMEYRLW